MEEIQELLVTGGYFRARISTLSPFDKLTGGLAFCIAASNVDVDYDHLDYSDDLVLGEKIQIGEAIESALQRMGCPQPLQAHQIQGLDYPAVLPVVKWLVNRVLATRQEVGDQLRRYSHFQFSKNYELPIHSQIKDEDCIRSRSQDPQFGHLQRISRQSRNMQLSFDRNARVEYTILEYGPESAQSAALAKQLEASKVSDINAVHNESCDKKVDNLRNQLEHRKERLQFLMSGGHGVYNDEKETRKETLLSNLVKLHADFSDQEKAEKIINILNTLKVLQREKAVFHEASQAERSSLEGRLSDLKEQLSSPPSTRLSSEELYEKKIAVRRELAELSRKIVTLRRRVDDVPVQSELMQYERCFMELYVNIQAKLRETRKYFATYNALVEANELTLKEVSLLNSINNQYDMAMGTSGGRETFVESMQGIANGAQQKLRKMEERCSEKKQMLISLQEKHGTAVATRRQYYALLKQLQEEVTRTEKLKA